MNLENLRRAGARVITGLLACLLLACGGGGGGGGGGDELNLSLTPSRVDATLAADTWTQFVEEALVSGTVSGPVYIFVVDPAGILAGPPSIMPTSDVRYRVIFQTRVLLAGDYSGTLTIQVCGDGACNREFTREALPYHLVVTNPAPTLSSLGTRSASAGCGSFDLVVLGNNFSRDAVVLWNGVARTTSYVSPTTLRATLLAADLSDPTTSAVRVMNPSPGGGQTPTLAFSVDTTVRANTPFLTAQYDASHTGIGTTRCPGSPPTDQLWFKGSLGTERPVILGGRVYVPSDSAGQVYAFDAATGASAWSAPSYAVFPTVGSDGSRLFVTSYDGGLFSNVLSARSLDDGSTQWSSGSIAQFGQQVINPVAAGGRVVVSKGDLMAAFDAQTGTPLWTRTAPSAPYASGNSDPVVVTPGGVFTCGAAGIFASNGIPAWDVPNGDCADTRFDAPSLAGTRLFVSGFDGGTEPGIGYILDAFTGAQLGTYSSSTTPVIEGEVGYFSSPGAIEKRPLDGGPALWSAQLPATTPPLRFNDWVIVGTTGGVVALDAQTGRTVWDLFFNDQTNVMAVGEGYLFLGDRSDSRVRLIDLGGR